jgi:hypothetical protein
MTMRFSEIRARPAAPDTHPFVTDLTIAPAALDDFERAMEDRPEVTLLCRIDRPDAWVAHVGCASGAVRRRLHHTWG